MAKVHEGQPQGQEGQPQGQEGQPQGQEGQEARGATSYFLPFLSTANEDRRQTRGRSSSSSSSSIHLGFAAFLGWPLAYVYNTAFNHKWNHLGQ